MLLLMVQNRVFILTISMVANPNTVMMIAHEFGSGKVKPMVETVPGACHKHFRTHAQAEAFIDDWKTSFADISRRVIKEKLDRGFRPQDMKLNFEGMLRPTSAYGEVEDISRDMNEKLNLKD